MATTATAPAPAPAPSSGPFKIVLRTMRSLVLLFVLICSVIAVAWLILNPPPPAFRLDSLSLSGLPNASDVSSPPLKLHVRIRLTTFNPNKKLALVIQDVDLYLAIIHRGHRFPLLSHNDTSLSDYCIGKRGRRVLTFEEEAGLTPGRGRRKRLYRFTQGSAVMSVEMKVSVEYMHGYWPSKRASVEVKCGDVSIGLPSPTRTGELKDGGKDCLVGFA